MFIINKLKTISPVQIVAVILIVIGIVITIRYGIGLFQAYREITYAQEHGFDTGNPDPALIRPWMTMRYIAVAYTVPQEYLFATLDIPMQRDTVETPLNQLNDQFFEAQENPDRRPIILEKVAQAIQQYRQNPVPTGLRKGGVRPWMSVQYIANSTGIPADYIFEQLEISPENNAFITLDRLADEVDYPQGGRALVDKIQQLVDTYEESP